MIPYRTPDPAATIARLTYADALAACVERYGAPRDIYAISARARAWWAMSWDGESETEDGLLLAETGEDAIDLHAMRGPAAEERWALAGDGATPLADALDAADAWMATRDGAPGCGGGAR